MQARFNELQANSMDHTQMTGIEYDLWYHTLQPSYFVIRKNQRYSPTKVELLSLYYIVEGSIYQTPTIGHILSNRLMTSLHFVNRAFDIGREASRFHPVQGYHWDSDEKDIIKQRNEIIKTSRTSSQLRTAEDQMKNIELRYQVDQIIYNSFIPKATKESNNIIVEERKRPSVSQNATEVLPKKTKLNIQL